MHRRTEVVFDDSREPLALRFEEIIRPRFRFFRVRRALPERKSRRGRKGGDFNVEGKKRKGKKRKREKEREGGRKKREKERKRKKIKKERTFRPGRGGKLEETKLIRGLPLSDDNSREERLLAGHNERSYMRSRC